MLVGCSSTRSIYREQETAKKRPAILIAPVPTAATNSDPKPSFSSEQLLTNEVGKNTQAAHWLGVLFNYDFGIQDPAQSGNHDKYKEKSFEIIDARLSGDELEQFTDKARSTPLKSAAWFRLGELSLEKRDYSLARKFFGRCMAITEEPTRSERARQYLEQLESLKKVEPKTVGVVLPLTGKQAGVSQKILRGIQLGLGFGSKIPTSFRLAVVDSEANPDLARRGIDKLIKEDNVIAIVGGVISKTATAEAAMASELGVPLITLTQKSGITEIGPNIFRNSMTSEMQVRNLVRTAMHDLHLTKFAIIFPNDSYGIEYANIFWDEVLARGGEITAAQSYSPKETDFRFAVQKLVGTYYIEARHDEYKLRAKEQQDTQQKKTDRDKVGGDILPPVVNFDAIFIPDGAKAMGQISAMLAYNGIKGVKLLGTNLWNISGIAKRAGPFSESLLFVDSFLSTDEKVARSSFVRDFKAVYSDEPGVFELQGYDSALVLRQLVAQGATNRDSLNESLNRLSDFNGALGELSMSEDREILRPLLSLTLSNGIVVPFQSSLSKK